MFIEKHLKKQCFPYRGKYWFRNIVEIPHFIKEIFFLIRHGYYSDDVWNIDAWFLRNLPSLLERYENNRQGEAVIFDGIPISTDTDADGNITNQYVLDAPAALKQIQELRLSPQLEHDLIISFNIYRQAYEYYEFNDKMFHLIVNKMIMLAKRFEDEYWVGSVEETKNDLLKLFSFCFFDLWD